MFTIITHVTGLLLLAFGGRSNQVFASHLEDVAEDSCNKLGEGAMLEWKNGLEQVKGGELDSMCPQLKASFISPIRNIWRNLVLLSCSLFTTMSRTVPDMFWEPSTC